VEKSKVEIPNTQRFDVVIVWKSDRRLTEEEVQDMVAPAIMDADSDAMLDVEEIKEPVY
jgi:hypothetical protein